MQTELSKKLGVEHAIFGFTPFPAVAAAITRAGGFGVLGAVRYTAPDDLKRDLDWMQEHTSTAGPTASTSSCPPRRSRASPRPTSRR